MSDFDKKYSDVYEHGEQEDVPSALRHPRPSKSGRAFCCKKCGYTQHQGQQTPVFCPHCGERVISRDEQ